MKSSANKLFNVYSNIMKAGSIVYAAAQQLDQSLYDINESQITRDRTFAKLDSELV